MKIAPSHPQHLFHNSRTANSEIRFEPVSSMITSMSMDPGAIVRETVNWFNDSGLQPRSPRGGGNPQYEYVGNPHINWDKL